VKDSHLIQMDKNILVSCTGIDDGQVINFWESGTMKCLVHLAWSIVEQLAHVSRFACGWSE